ncbi:hypothetical protein LVJ85_08175 [Neisseria sp. Dent CA1/247]|uniref:hypothetical protein n=1 Tax=Neisseria sp. Dent CA1/247 TaxID=2912675 RepID=UPI001FD571A4|nr:hypothetical protein [Neisseria sp. Dent CA1/247]UOO76024.1 hypothetical protein LVJ85_08175 [Neisseria sp. Dent CA1/247]
MTVIGSPAAASVVENIKTVYAAAKGMVFALLMVFGYIYGRAGIKNDTLAYRKAEAGL